MVDPAQHGLILRPGLDLTGGGPVV
jgi:hypothetical protein